jgi:hypothetical protein
VVVVQPNNPTGSFLDDGERAWLAEVAASTGRPLISDEVFLDSALPGAAADAVTLAGRSEALTFTMSGLSKLCGLPQLKLGWIVVSGPEPARRRALEGLEWIADTFLSVATPVQRALPQLLAARHGFLAAAAERLAVNEAWLRGRLAGTAVTARPRQGGWTLILDLPRTRSDDEWSLELLDRGVLLHPGHFYDLNEEAGLVAGLLTPPNDWARGIEILLELVDAG